MYRLVYFKIDYVKINRCLVLSRALVSVAPEPRFRKPRQARAPEEPSTGESEDACGSPGAAAAAWALAAVRSRHS